VEPHPATSYDRGDTDFENEQSAPLASGREPHPGAGYHVPTLAEILSSLESDASLDEPGAVEDEPPAVEAEPAAVEDEPAAVEDEPPAVEDEPAAADDDEPPAADDKLSTPEVRRRAVTGAVVDAMRGIGVRLVGLIGTAVTARLLTPYDFGLVAIGATIVTFGSFLSDGGVGTALIRRPEPPTKSELQALVAFQFGLDVLVVLGVAIVMLPFGVLGEVTTVIVASLPLGAFRTGSYILYERRLDYRPMAMVEVVETSVYYVWAIVTVVIGWGVWGLATAAVARALFGSALLFALLPEGRVAPIPSWTKVKKLLGFGFRYQAVGFLGMMRDQGVNIVVAAFGGVAVLGLWSVAWRILQIPYSFFVALWRVSFPGMSRLVHANEDVGSTIERVIGLVAIGTGALVAPLAASASPWIHVLIGAKWAEAASAIPPACFAMAFGVPISVALAGYLWAVGSASVPLRATIIGIPAMLLLLLPLLPVIGVVAVGLAYIISALVESIFFIRGARRTTTFKVGSRLAVPVLAATVAGACGWLVAHWIGPNLAGALLSSACAFGVFVGVLAAVHRAELADASRLIIRGLRGAVAAPARA
jgi:O-antigen/teichoic acid export membrane protein